MSLLTNRRRGVRKKSNPYLMTSETNPEVLAICYAQGWCASPDYMTYEEAATVTDAQLAQTFINTKIKTFDEFKYFTSITSLSDYAFLNCKDLVSIKMPNSLISTGITIFSGCSKLNLVELNHGLKTIGGNIFRGCTSLENIVIPNSVTAIDAGTCSKCSSLQTITVGNSVTSIPNYMLDNCSALQSITMLRTTPPSLSYPNLVFNNASNNFIIYVPADSVDVYKSASGWSTYASRIQAIPT